MIDASQLTLSHAGLDCVRCTRGAGSASARRSTLPEMERQALVQALQRNDGNVTRAARELGISRDTLRYRIEKYGLSAESAGGFADSQT